jgi:hypothetical protein
MPFPTFALIVFMQAWHSPLTNMHAAYIDPNTGGMLFQLLAVLFAVFSGMLLFFSRQVKTIFSRFLRFLRNLIGRS